MMLSYIVSMQKRSEGLFSEQPHGTVYYIYMKFIYRELNKLVLKHFKNVLLLLLHYNNNNNKVTFKPNIAV